ncbi:hypothetical protein EMCG_02229 [[Emmonsia] crescens]|uniref:Uncharacterized protein n=1 Tax=[Emmonsia] crescens TaxID=73230 RepID=A0A0G2HZG9_9EURO|nr:hypothetical protein EMCG_02229 [Emmonsia crescens UAMH 3008]
MVIGLTSAKPIYHREAAFQTDIEKRGELQTLCVSSFVDSGIKVAAEVYPNAKEALDQGARVVLHNCLPQYTDVAGCQKCRKGVVSCITSAYMELSGALTKNGATKDEVTGVLAILARYQAAAMNWGIIGCNDDA